MFQIGIDLRLLDLESVVTVLPRVEGGTRLVPLLFGVMKIRRAVLRAWP